MFTLSLHLFLTTLSLLPHLTLHHPFSLTMASLLLSVGASGQVHSFEMVHAHLLQAKTNYHNWCNSWNLSHPHRPWPDNVHFIEGDVSDATDYVQNWVDAVSINYDIV